MQTKNIGVFCRGTPFYTLALFPLDTIPITQFDSLYHNSFFPMEPLLCFLFPFSTVCSQHPSFHVSNPCSLISAFQILCHYNIIKVKKKIKIVLLSNSNRLQQSISNLNQLTQMGFHNQKLKLVTPNAEWGEREVPYEGVRAQRCY